MCKRKGAPAAPLVSFGGFCLPLRDGPAARGAGFGVVEVHPRPAAAAWKSGVNPRGENHWIDRSLTAGLYGMGLDFAVIGPDNFPVSGSREPRQDVPIERGRRVEVAGGVEKDELISGHIASVVFQWSTVPRDSVLSRSDLFQS